MERDLEKITNLKRRFRRSIGIIPGMPGKAGALFGAGVGMGLILPFGFKWPEKSPNIPPIGKPQPPLTPEPSPVYVPVDVPQPVPVDVPDTVPVDVPVNVPGGVPGDITDIIPDVTGGIKDPLQDIIEGVTGGVTDVIGDPGPTDIPIIPGKGGEVEIPHQGGELINPGAYAWVDNLNPQQVWEILKANLGKPIVWKILAVAGVSAALLFIPFDGQALSVLGSIKVLSMLKYAIGAGLLIIPATIAPASATETSNLNNSNLNNSNLNINNSIGDFSTSSSDIASLQLNTRKTDTVVIITDTPLT